MKTVILTALIILFFCLPYGLDAFGQSNVSNSNDSYSFSESKAGEKDRGGRFSLSLLGGGSYWGDLGSIESLHSDLSQYGKLFHKWGLNFEASLHYYQIPSLGNGLRLGLDFGVLGFSSDKFAVYPLPEYDTTEDASAQINVYYFTPSVRYRFGKKPKNNSPQLYIGGGGGPYRISIGSSAYIRGNETYYTNWAFGGYASGGISILLHEYNHFALSFLAEGKIHFLRFSDFESFSTSEKWLNGPVPTFQFGICLDNMK